MMTERVQWAQDQTVDYTIQRGSQIIAERHEILARILQGDLTSGERDGLARRFRELGLEWHMLTAVGESRH